MTVKFSHHTRHHLMLCLNTGAWTRGVSAASGPVLSLQAAQKTPERENSSPLVEGACLAPAEGEQFRTSITNSLRQHLISSSWATSEVLCSQHSHSQHGTLRVFVLGTRDPPATSSWCNHDNAVKDLHDSRIWEKKPYPAPLGGHPSSQWSSPLFYFEARFLGQLPPLCVPNNSSKLFSPQPISTLILPLI